jgi:hypothetical protein
LSATTARGHYGLQSQRFGTLERIIGRTAIRHDDLDIQHLGNFLERMGSLTQESARILSLVPMVLPSRGADAPRIGLPKVGDRVKSM